MSARTEWRLLFWFLIGLPLLLLAALEGWPVLVGWLTGPAPWWFLPTVGFVGFLLVVVASLWRDLFPRKSP